MKLQWKSVSPDQERRFSLLKERKNLIGRAGCWSGLANLHESLSLAGFNRHVDNCFVLDKDVTRTDRVHQFYKGDNNPNIDVLYDILMTYCMYNFDLGGWNWFWLDHTLSAHFSCARLYYVMLCYACSWSADLISGYVQGMSDLLAPILVIMENEVDAFWCLAGFMERVVSSCSIQSCALTTLYQCICHIVANSDHIFVTVNRRTISKWTKKAWRSSWLRSTYWWSIWTQNSATIWVRNQRWRSRRRKETDENNNVIIYMSVWCASTTFQSTMR